MTEETDLVTVRTAAGWHLAQIYKSKLDAAEIPSMLKYDSSSLVYGLTVDALGEVQVLVPRAFAEEAEALLQDQPLDDTEEEDEGPAADSDAEAEPD